MPDLDLSNTPMILFILAVFIGVLYLINYRLEREINLKRMQFSNSAACRKVLKEHRWRLLTDYFWSDYMRFAWIMLLLVLSIGILLAIDHTITIILAALVTILTVFFLRFAIKSYKAFPEKAAARLQKFETEVENTLKTEISFKGDNIQSFSSEDDNFDTNPIIFSFPTDVSKVAFPPFESNPRKQPIIKTRRMEYLILSREYFSICKNANTFNLLDPARFPPMKQCAEISGKAGECHEHYYSQMRNVEYDNAKECIRIIYYDERDDVEFPCKKLAPNRKPAMKALQEKLRLTERQRLHKIDEHEKFEKIQERRSRQEESDETEEDESDNSNSE
jgi:Ca2+/Na+ antiporter